MSKRKSSAAGRLGLEAKAPAKASGKAAFVMAAWKVPVDTLADMRAFAQTTRRTQADIVSEALRQWLDVAIPKSNEADTIKALSAAHARAMRASG